MVVRLKPKSLRQIRRELAYLPQEQCWCADHPITVEEFNRIAPETNRLELYNGALHQPIASNERTAVAAFVLKLLRGYVREAKVGIVRDSRHGIHLDMYSVPRPDASFIANTRRQFAKAVQDSEFPEMLVQVVCSELDRIRTINRLTRYINFKVPELWYIDLQYQLLRVTHRNGEGQFQTIFEGNKGIARSKAVKGFAVRAEWLWRDEENFPDIVATVQELIAGRVPR